MPEKLNCGSCTACCTVMEVVELEKKAGVPCCHLAEGCSIYQNRPASCSGWSCMWLLGFLNGDEAMRPDRLGLVFILDLRLDTPILTAFEVWEGAAQGEAAAAVIERLRHNGPLLVGLFNSRRSLAYSFPEELLQQFKELSE